MGGFHTEYTGMKLALFLLAEYVHMITTSLLVATLFFGGWELPWVAAAAPGPDNVGTIILKLIVLSMKMILFIIFFMFVRWTVPRFRFDQLMGLAWKVLMPLALFNVVCVLIVRQFQPLWSDLDIQLADARDVAARTVQAGNQAQFYWIAAGGEYDRDAAGCIFCRKIRRRVRCNQRHLPMNKIGHHFRQALVTSLGPVKFDRKILALDEAGLFEALAESSYPSRVAVGG